MKVPGPGGKEVSISVFDKITVDVSIERDRNTQRGRVKMTMVNPVNSNYL
jgi:exosome complex exonuclease DIS3/RRP44